MNFNEQVLGAFNQVLKQVAGVIPKLFQILVFILVAWLFIKVTLFIVGKFLVKVKVDKWSEKLKDTKIFGNSTINIVLSKIILMVIKWMLILIFLMVGAEIFGIKAISDGLAKFFGFLPKLITALIIFAGGAYLGTLVKNSILKLFSSIGMSGGKVIGNFVFFIIIIFFSITALEQAEIDTTIIRQNVTLILGSMLLAFSISFGLGAKEAVTRLLFGYYSKKNIGIGAKVNIDGVEGIVVDIDNICITIANEKGKVVFPIKYVVDNKVTILK